MTLARHVVRVLLSLTIVAVWTGIGWSPVAGKAMVMRLPSYLVLAWLGPIMNRVRPQSTTGIADACLLLALWIDVAGNALGRYDNWRIYDDAAHVAIAGLLVVATIFFFVPVHERSARYIATLAVAIGCAYAVAWELFEWGGWALGVRNLHLGTRDTLLDIMHSVVGGCGAAAILATYHRRRYPTPT